MSQLIFSEPEAEDEEVPLEESENISDNSQIRTKLKLSVNDQFIAKFENNLGASFFEKDSVQDQQDEEVPSIVQKSYEDIQKEAHLKQRIKPKSRFYKIMKKVWSKSEQCELCKGPLKTQNQQKALCGDCMFAQKIARMQPTRPPGILESVRALFQIKIKGYSDYRDTQAELLEYINNANVYYSEINTAERIKDFPNDIQVNLNKYYFQKLWITYGQTGMLLLMQGLLYCSTKHQEAKFFQRLDRHHHDHGLDGIEQIGTLHQFDQNYVLIKAFDFVMIIHFWMLNYLKIVWQMHSREWEGRAIDIDFQNHDSYKTTVYNYSLAYSSFFVKTFLIILQPLEIFNTDRQTSFDYPAQFEVIEERRKWGQGQYVRYFGLTNYLLCFVYVLARFSVLVWHLVWFYFQNTIKLSRVMSFFEVQMEFQVMVKTIYQKYKVTGTTALCFISVICFATMMIEFEMNINILQSLFEVIYYLVVTMTTVGYGDYHVDSFVGQNTIILATFFGVIFEGMFLVAWSDYIKFDDNQYQVYLLQTRIQVKKELKLLIASRFTAMRKIQLINREQVKYQEKGELSNNKLEQLHNARILQQRKKKEAGEKFKEIQIKYDVLTNDDDYRKSGFRDTIVHRSTIMSEIIEKTKQVKNNIQNMQTQIREKQYGLKIINSYIKELNDVDELIKEEKDCIRLMMMFRLPYYQQKMQLRRQRIKRARLMKFQFIKLDLPTYYEQNQNIIPASKKTKSVTKLKKNQSQISKITSQLQRNNQISARSYVRSPQTNPIKEKYKKIKHDYIVRKQREKNPFREFSDEV